MGINKSSVDRFSDKMNILPKKRWHVRTRDNIARVRRDEAKAAEDEKEKQRRALLAEQETRTTVLRKRARERQGIEDDPLPDAKKAPLPTTETRYELVFKDGACVSIPVTEVKNTVQFSASGHVNFFENLEEGKQIEGTKNKDHENENKAEQEEYEKKIGLLTYLGQGSKESTGESAWYEKPSLLRSLQQEEVKTIDLKSEKAKELLDPLRVVKRYLGTTDKFKPSSEKTRSDLRFPKKLSIEQPKSKKSKKLKKRKKTKKKKDEDSSDSSEDNKRIKLAILRAKRLEREKEGRVKTNKLLATIHGEPHQKSSVTQEPLPKPKPERKYHSQYNPDLARQNQPLDSSTKYWLN